MRNFIPRFAMFLTMAFAIMSAGAQSFPYNNPTYIPSAILAPQTLSAPGSFIFQTTGQSTLTVRITGTCTSLAGTLQGSNDATNYTAINLYPIATGTSAPTAVASYSAAGFWKANVTGFTQVKINVTALTASCVFALVGTQGDFNGAQF